MKRAFLSTSLVILLTGAAFAQTEPAFEVASVKPNTSDDHRASMRMGGSELLLNNFSLKRLIMLAYDVKNFSISGPDWLDNVRFDVAAKPPAGMTREQLKPMLRALLEERFKLQVHRESKTMTGYALVVGKGGLKVKELEESVGDNNGNAGSQISVGRGQLTASRMTMKSLADWLQNPVDRPIADMTEIKGSFDIKLEWTPEENPVMAAAHGAATGPNEGAERKADAGPTIFTALQEQLGLRLQTQKVPVDTVIIDRVERTPTEN